MNEEVQKKNTDCVYFLASPLTCKKGNDCEFRHSESARNNPRDCWYWLSGSCLNANCAFRHPPLEAIPEGELAAGGKPRVPCYYFMQGYCAKGDKCIFMHGLPTASEVSQKVSKPNVTKSEVPDNQTSANKGNGSATSKASFEFYDAPSEAPLQKSNQVIKDVDLHVTQRLPEGSDSSAPARSRLPQSNISDRSKQVSVTNGRLNQVHSSDDKFLHQEAQTEEEPICDFQPGDDGLGQDPSGDDQMHEGTESEEMWEESSFDVLVDDGGTDQLIYADDLDYLNQYDALVDQLTRGADGFVDFDYDHAGAYGQYYDAAEYELATYDAYEQQLVYEQLGSFDPEDGMQPVVAFKNRQGKDMLPRVRRDVSFDGEGRPQRVNVGSNDLRNHIVKRRRAEKNQKYGDDHNRRRHQGNGSQHNRRHQDGHFKQQEGPARRHLSPKSGSRLNRPYPGRGEPPGIRQFHGRFVEPSGTKRPFRDLASDHEEIGAERGSGKKFRGMNDTFRAKLRKERGRPAVTGVDEALGSRAHQQSKKMESRKEDASFARPKSLAEIKAEKLKATQAGCSAGQHDHCGERNGVVEELPENLASQMRSKIPHRSYKEPPFKELGKPAKPAMHTESDFEGPKPLSVILRQKRRGESEGEARDQRHEKALGTGVGSKPAPFIASSRDASVPAHYSSADSLGVCDHNDGYATHSVDHGSRGYGERKSLMHGAQDLATFSTNLRGHQEADMNRSRLDRELDPVFDTEDGVDVGEDVDFEDEDEDDFAKKLGGFLS
ncbi:hypothetical protein GOP47_0004784 [Adiantum capillus-veneris]|uniref:C3H1-type domain-containing protein n=1 Tax=Adiantum capillus-veneris TaxID=13818 RepID=A0A9D4V3X0_ADICA|nr:hypothetical protein GOP47_0004784 [Adiantum capillus-veneris]